MNNSHSDAQDQIGHAFEAVGRGENSYDLVFDPATGELRAVGDDRDEDRVPATQMAREGFFHNGGKARQPGLSDLCNSIEEGKKGYDTTAPAIAPLTAAVLENTQIAKYHAKGGAGYAAEDANNLSDRLHGKHAEVVGKSNVQHGADRLVDGVSVQSKYYNNPAATMQSAFEPHGGEYRYPGQVLEVPKDQYDQCVARMRERIREGRVPGYTDPADAEQLVKKGTVTFEQARNIARAGNISSLLFDVKTGAVVSSGAFGTSFVIDYAQCLWRGANNAEAVEHALKEALRTGASTLVTHVASAQLLRTKAAAVGTAAARRGVRAIARTSAGRKAVEGIAAASLGKSVHGAAAVNHVSKLLRSNAITGGVTAVVMCTPDFYRAAFDESISWRQFTKNSLVNVASVGGGAVGWMAGAAAGAAAGSVIPFIGTAAGGIIGGILGSVTGGASARRLAKSIADQLVEDDVAALVRVLEHELQKLCHAYMLSEPEVKRIIALVGEAADDKWLRGMYKETGGEDESGRRFVRRAFEHEFKEIARRRPKVVPPSAKRFAQGLENLAVTAAA